MDNPATLSCSDYLMRPLCERCFHRPGRRFLCNSCDKRVGPCCVHHVCNIATGCACGTCLEHSLARAVLNHVYVQSPQLRHPQVILRQPLSSKNDVSFDGDYTWSCNELYDHVRSVSHLFDCETDDDFDRCVLKGCVPCEFRLFHRLEALPYSDQPLPAGFFNEGGGLVDILVAEIEEGGGWSLLL